MKVLHSHESIIMKKSITSYVLIGLVLFLAIGAIWGGLNLVVDPSGQGIGFPPKILEQLEQSPFPTFLIPGLFLFLFLGVFPMITTYGLITRRELKWAKKLNPYKNRHWSWTFSYHIGLLLILWINVQLFFGIEFGVLHFVYTLLGVLIVFVAHLSSTKKVYFIP